MGFSLSPYKKAVRTEREIRLADMNFQAVRSHVRILVKELDELTMRIKNQIEVPKEDV